MQSKVSEEVLYPESDRVPLGEPDAHVNEVADLLKMLQARYFDRNDVYVSSSLTCYYEEGIAELHPPPRPVYREWAHADFGTQLSRLELPGERLEVAE